VLPPTVVDALALLLVGLGSVSDALTCAVSVAVPALIGRTVKVTVVLAPVANCPRLHAAGLTEQVPAVAAAETKNLPRANSGLRCSLAEH